MDYYKFATPITLPAAGVTYFSANSNKGLFVCSSAPQTDYVVDVVHVTGTTGATAWFRYRQTNNTNPLQPFFITPAVVAGVSASIATTSGIRNIQLLLLN
jgi:hypothetical protein